MRNKLPIDLSSMADSNDGDDDAAILYLVDNAVIANTDAVGIPAFKFLTTGRQRILFLFGSHFLRNPPITLQLSPLIAGYTFVYTKAFWDCAK